MALPTRPSQTGQEEDLHAKFLNEVMGRGNEPDVAPIPEPAPGESSPFAGSLTFDEVFETLAENDAMVEEREQEQTWQKLKPRAEEHANRKVALWVLITLVITASAVIGAYFVSKAFQPDPQPPVVIEKPTTGYEVPDNLIG